MDPGVVGVEWLGVFHVLHFVRPMIQKPFVNYIWAEKPTSTSVDPGDSYELSGFKRCRISRDCNCWYHYVTSVSWQLIAKQPLFYLKVWVAVIPLKWLLLQELEVMYAIAEKTLNSAAEAAFLAGNKV